MSESTGDGRLDAALDGVADALAGLPPAHWARLCQREPAEIIATLQLFELGEQAHCRNRLYMRAALDMRA